MSKQQLAMSISIIGLIALFAGMYGIVANNVSMFIFMACAIIAGGVWAFYNPQKN